MLFEKRKSDINTLENDFCPKTFVLLYDDQYVETSVYRNGMYNQPFQRTTGPWVFISLYFTIVPFSLIVLLVFVQQSLAIKWRNIVHFIEFYLVSTLGTFGIAKVLSVAAQTPAPCYWDNKMCQNSYSFPCRFSAVSNGSLFVIIWYIISLENISEIARIIFISSHVSLQAYFILSRLYWHAVFPEDFMGGYIVGFIWPYVVSRYFSVTKDIFTKDNDNSEQDSNNENERDEDDFFSPILSPLVSEDNFDQPEIVDIPKKIDKSKNDNDDKSTVTIYSPVDDNKHESPTQKIMNNITEPGTISTPQFIKNELRNRSKSLPTTTKKMKTIPTTISRKRSVSFKNTKTVANDLSPKVTVFAEDHPEQSPSPETIEFDFDKAEKEPTTGSTPFADISTKKLLADINTKKLHNTPVSKQEKKSLHMNEEQRNVPRVKSNSSEYVA